MTATLLLSPTSALPVAAATSLEAENAAPITLSTVANANDAYLFRCTECGTEQLRTHDTRYCARLVPGARRRGHGGRGGICGGSLKRVGRPPSFRRPFLLALPRTTRQWPCPSFEELRRHRYVVADEERIVVPYPLTTQLEAIAVCWGVCAAEGAAALKRCLDALHAAAGQIGAVDWRLGRVVGRLAEAWEVEMPCGEEATATLDAVVKRVKDVETLGNGP